MIVGVGGSATVDGGLGALEALDFDLRGAEVVVACDVETRFVDAARIFGPQKGADAAGVDRLEQRLEALAERYRSDLGVDVRELELAGAAGGLAGGLAALGAILRPGAALVAETVGLRAALADCVARAHRRGPVRRHVPRGESRRARPRRGPGRRCARCDRRGRRRHGRARWRFLRPFAA